MSNKTDVVINGRPIGPDHPPYLVAELSANHNGSLQKAKDHICLAAKHGADAIKLQTYSADTMTIDCHKPDFVIQGGLWDQRQLYDLYQEASTPYEWHKPLFDHARQQGITCFSTPFDESAVDLLEDLNAPAYKIASFEAVDLPPIRYVAATKKPIIISTGMASQIEMAEALDAARSGGCEQLILLHCISSYPTPSDQYHVRTMSAIAQTFDVVVGLSDHSLDDTAAMAAVALGGCFVEKHFIESRSQTGPDSSFSIEPSELSRLKQNLVNTWQCLGRAGFHRAQVEEKNKQFRRSLYFVADACAGDVITSDMVKKIRPGFGLAPKYLDDVVGQTLAQSVSRGDAVAWQHIVGGGSDQGQE